MRRTRYDVWLDILAPLLVGFDGPKLLLCPTQIGEIFNFHLRLNG